MHRKDYFMDYKTKQIQSNTHIWNEYSRLEKNSPNSLIALKVGDFYEFWGRAANIISEQCELTIVYKEIDTKAADNNVAMVGIPAFALQKCCTELKKLGLSVDAHTLTTHSESFNDNVNDETKLQEGLYKRNFMKLETLLKRMSLEEASKIVTNIIQKDGNNLTEKQDIACAIVQSAFERLTPTDVINLYSEETGDSENTAWFGSCPECGFEVQIGENYCSKCGKGLKFNLNERKNFYHGK